MTDEQINQCIAEACGWTEIRNSVYRHHKPWGHPPLNRDRIKLLPDYCNDLNAMHEAESILDEDCRNGFRLELLNVTDSKYFGGFDHIHATARQRAEAFLRTLDKWDQSGERTEMVKEVQK